MKKTSLFFRIETDNQLPHPITENTRAFLGVFFFRVDISAKWREGGRGWLCGDGTNTKIDSYPPPLPHTTKLDIHPLQRFSLLLVFGRKVCNICGWLLFFARRTLYANLGSSA